MTEAENSGVMEEVAAPTAEDMGTAHAETEQPQVQETVQETDQAMNFRKLRESNEQLQKQSQEDRQMLTDLRAEFERRNAPAQTPQPEEVDELAGLASDDWLTKAQSEKQSQKIVSNAIRKAIAEDREKRRVEEAPQRLKARFADFDSVVTTENVNNLRALEPEIANALSMIGDEEAQAVAAYKYIKAFLPQAAETTASKQRIQKNANQPKSLSSTGGNSPLSQAGAFEKGLTPELKTQLFAEMRAAASQG